METATLITETGRVCIGCGDFKLWTEFYKHKQSKIGYYSRCKECSKTANYTSSAKSRLALKMMVLSAYGSQCSCCGESNWKFLTIDHFNDDGAEHRRKNNLTTSSKFYRWLRDNNYPKADFQCLCWNCNSGRYFNGGVCPHIEEVVAEYIRPEK